MEKERVRYFAIILPRESTSNQHRRALFIVAVSPRHPRVAKGGQKGGKKRSVLESFSRFAAYADRSGRDWPGHCARPANLTERPAAAV
jgi:hypothetical protein